MKVVIVGATGALGRALALVEAQRGSELTLVATDKRDLDVVSKDLAIRSNAVISICATDLRDSKSIQGISLDADRYYFPIGAISSADGWGISGEDGRAIVEVNFLNEATLIAQILAKNPQKKVDIVGIGSIAETRGRSKNVFYSSAKRALTSFYESLLHHSRQPAMRAGVKPYFFQIGYMNSQMSFGKKLLFPLAEPYEIANQILAHIDDENTGIHYLPKFWFWICLVLRHLPWAIYGKLKF